MLQRTLHGVILRGPRDGSVLSANTNQSERQLRHVSPRSAQAGGLHWRPHRQWHASMVQGMVRLQVHAASMTGGVRDRRSHALDVNAARSPTGLSISRRAARRTSGQTQMRTGTLLLQARLLQQHRRRARPRRPRPLQHSDAQMMETQSKPLQLVSWRSHPRLRARSGDPSRVVTTRPARPKTARAANKSCRAMIMLRMLVTARRTAAVVAVAAGQSEGEAPCKHSLLPNQLQLTRLRSRSRKNRWFWALPAAAVVAACACSSSRQLTAPSLLWQPSPRRCPSTRPRQPLTQVR